MKVNELEVKKFEKKSYCQRNSQSILQNPYDYLSPKIILNFQICISREWAEKAGQFSDAHCNTFTKDNEHGKPTSKGQVRKSQRTIDQVLSFQKNGINIWLKTNQKKKNVLLPEQKICVISAQQDFIIDMN